LDVQEMGCPDGLMAEVQSIEACPSIQDSPGRVILTTVAHLNSVGRTLTVRAIDGTTDQIHTTDYHPFWSETKQGWAQAYTLSIGDQLQGLGGRPLTLIATSRIPGVHTVYNLTVEHDHVYRVGISAVFVHNNCWEAEVVPNKKVVLGSPISVEQAIENVKSGQDVATDSLKEGRQIALGASENKNVIFDGKKKTELGNTLESHFHPVDSDGEKKKGGFNSHIVILPKKKH
jgi:Pretoxin HINT domain